MASNSTEEWQTKRMLTGAQLSAPTLSDATIEIKEMWRIVNVSGGRPISLRALWPKGRPGGKPTINKLFRGFDYPDVDQQREAFEREALELNALGYNIYIVMNPIKAEFSSTAVRDQDIDYRDLLLIDIDRAGETDHPATDLDVDAARKVAERISAYLQTQGFQNPVQVMSGNGHHLYFHLPQPGLTNDEVAKDCVRELLHKLAAEFDTSSVKVDTTVFNASRITKVVGTVARKGIESKDRPYRLARAL